MEAARVCAERGHRVTLYEREEELGGMLRWAALLPQRGGWVTFLEQARRRLRAAGVAIRLGEAIDAELLQHAAADVLVCATGSRFIARAGDTPGLPVLTPPEALATRAPGYTLVAGAGAIGLGVAAWLAAEGGRVTVIAPEATVEDPDGQPGLLERLAGTGRVDVRAERDVVSVADGEVVLARAGAIGPLFAERLHDVDTIVRADVRRASDGLAERARESGLVETVLEVGDCHMPRDALAAVYEGAAAGHGI
jgi:NADPH-dependent 2,4-dienoyl-CoA reductase/sulfur reductase-like enzyme